MPYCFLFFSIITLYGCSILRPQQPIPQNPQALSGGAQVHIISGTADGGFFGNNTTYAGIVVCNEGKEKITMEARRYPVSINQVVSNKGSTEQEETERTTTTTTSSTNCIPGGVAYAAGPGIGTSLVGQLAEFARAIGLGLISWSIFDLNPSINATASATSSNGGGMMMPMD
jgi:hypothetical protein